MGSPFRPVGHNLRHSSRYGSLGVGFVSLGLAIHLQSIGRGPSIVPVDEGEVEGAALAGVQVGTVDVGGLAAEDDAGGIERADGPDVFDAAVLVVADQADDAIPARAGIVGAAVVQDDEVWQWPPVGGIGGGLEFIVGPAGRLGQRELEAGFRLGRQAAQVDVGGGDAHELAVAVEEVGRDLDGAQVGGGVVPDLAGDLQVAVGSDIVGVVR